MTPHSQNSRPRWTVAVLSLLVSVSTALGQDARFEFPGISIGVRDTAKVFSPEAVRKAQADIDRIERQSKASVLIETVEIGRAGLGQDGRRGERQAVGTRGDLRPDRQERPPVRGRADPGPGEGREPGGRPGLPGRLPHPVQARQVRRGPYQRRPGHGAHPLGRGQGGKARPPSGSSGGRREVQQARPGNPGGIRTGRAEPGQVDPERRAPDRRGSPGEGGRAENQSECRRGRRRRPSPLLRSDGRRPACERLHVDHQGDQCRDLPRRDRHNQCRARRHLAPTQPPERRRGQRRQDHHAQRWEFPSLSTARSSAPWAWAAVPAIRTPPSHGPASTGSCPHSNPKPTANKNPPIRGRTRSRFRRRHRQPLQRIEHSVNRGIERRGACRQTDRLIAQKPRGIDIGGRLNVKNRPAPGRGRGRPVPSCCSSSDPPPPRPRRPGRSGVRASADGPWWDGRWCRRIGPRRPGFRFSIAWRTRVA